MRAAAVWLREIRDRVPGGLSVDWRYFSLEQVNERAGAGVKVWDRPDGYESTGMDAFAGAEAARRQDRADAWEKLHAAMLEAQHTGDKQPLTADLVARLADQAGFDMQRYHRDLEDPSILRPVAQQHEEAVVRGVFGTPTIFFESGEGAYLKLMPPPTGDEALRAWENLQPVIAGRPYVQEVKRPQKPKSD